MLRGIVNSLPLKAVRSRKIVVKNVPTTEQNSYFPKANEEALEARFGEFGEIVDIQANADRGIAYIIYTDDASAEKAVSNDQDASLSISALWQDFSTSSAPHLTDGTYTDNHQEDHKPRRSLYQSIGPRQIRLLVFVPSSVPTQIELKLETTTLLDNAFVQYDALSYEWGSSGGPEHDIIVDGHRVQVRENLYRALKQFNSDHTDWKLWIDAICINQQDISERNQQVSLMGEVYRRASKVRVWMGLSNNQSREASLIVTAYRDPAEFFLNNLDPRKPQGLLISAAVRTVSKSDAAFRSKLDGDRRVRTSRRLVHLRDQLFVPKNGIQGYSLDALASFMERSYWSRVWIVQEFLLASKVIIHCGPDIINAQDLGDLLQDIAKSKSEWISNVSPWLKAWIDQMYESIGTVIVLGRQLNQGHSLAALVKALKRSKCQEPRDRIYAILGVANDVPSGAIPINYRRSIFKIKMDVAWFFHNTKGVYGSEMSNICSWLDEMFADCEDEDD